MNFPWTLITGLMTGNLVFTHLSPIHATSTSSTWTVHTEETVKERLGKIKLPFEVEADELILDRINMYVSGGRRETAVMMGRAEVYFPIYEHYLRKYDLPESLKYLPMIESGLNPGIRSGAGAVGMWQLMDVTARHYGLTINEYIDERSDPYRSTEAAVRLLSDLYCMFDDWSLVLAAYNGGHGRVLRAIELAGCDDYEEVLRFLPRETRRYVPYFVAAAYIDRYHGEHGIQPKIPHPLSLHTRAVEVHQYLSFGEIAKATGLEQTYIAGLNPALLRGAVPRTHKGCYLVLPEERMEAVRDLLARKAGRDRKAVIPPDTFRYAHLVRAGDNLEELAGTFQCTAEEIMAWNNLAGADIVVNQELYIYLSKAYIFNRA